MRKADNLPPPCVVTKPGNLNLLEPSRPVQACNGTALPLPLPYHDQYSSNHEELDWRGGVHVFWWGDLRERSQHKREVNIKMDLLELG